MSVYTQRNEGEKTLIKRTKIQIRTKRKQDHVDSNVVMCLLEKNNQI